jgi:molybdopterin-containing oxidoreductase family membrane subunit
MLAYWAVLGIVALVGLAAIAVRSTEGLRVTNLTSLVPWGLWVAFYIYFIGLSAGSFLISTMIYVFGVKRFEPVGRMAIFVAFIAMLTGLMFVLLDLGHMERFWTVFFNRNSRSVLEWEIHFYNLYVVILLSELWLLMRRDLIRCSRGQGLKATVCRLLALGSKDLSEASAAKDMRAVRILGTLGVPVALAVHGGTGAIFAVVKARPYWYTGLFPLIFIVSALASGGALLTFLYAFFGRKDKEHSTLVAGLGKMVAGFLALDLVFLASETLVGLYGAVPDHLATYQAIMTGPFWYVFWIGQLGLGAVVPLFLILFRRTRQSAGWIGVAGALIVTGILGVRLNIVIPPLTVPLMPGIDTAYPLGRFSTFDFTGLAGTLFSLAIAAFVIASGWIIAHLTRLPRRPAERWLARAAGLAVVAGFVFMGLRFLDVGVAPEVVALSGAPARLPLFFGGSVRAQDPTFYSPSPIEWLSSMGLVALAAIGFTAGKLLLPLEAGPEPSPPEPRRFAGFEPQPSEG